MTKSNLSMGRVHYYRGLLIFLTTQRNSHGCLISADGNAMLMVLRISRAPFQTSPSRRGLGGGFSGSTCAKAFVRMHISAAADKPITAACEISFSQDGRHGYLCVE